LKESLFKIEMQNPHT